MDAIRNLPHYPILKHTSKDLTVRFAPSFVQEQLNSALQYKAQPDDIFVCTFPKCGTTWMQNIVWLITRNGNPLPPGVLLCDVSPCLEFRGCEYTLSLPPPRVIKTHLPFPFVPQSKQAKYIYVARNPKDSLVSYYFHVKGFEGFYKCPAVTLDGIFEAYLKGEVEYDNCLNHIGAWYQRRNESNVLFILYENLKKTPEACIIKIARFLGQKYEKSCLAEDRKILNKIIELSSFKEMRKNDTAWTNNLKISHDYKFTRKGEIGDWKNYLTSEQSSMIDQWMREKGSVHGIDKLWKDYPEV